MQEGETFEALHYVGDILLYKWLPAKLVEYGRKRAVVVEYFGGIPARWTAWPVIEGPPITDTIILRFCDFESEFMTLENGEPEETRKRRVHSSEIGQQVRVPNCQTVDS